MGNRNEITKQTTFYNKYCTIPYDFARRNNKLTQPEFVLMKLNLFLHVMGIFFLFKMIIIFDMVIQ